jgi:hypothetical protein
MSRIQLVEVMHLKVGCQLPYKVRRKRRLKEGVTRDDETNSVYSLICGFIVRVEDLVHFR